MTFVLVNPPIPLVTLMQFLLLERRMTELKFVNTTPPRAVCANSPIINAPNVNSTACRLREELNPFGWRVWPDILALFGAKASATVPFSWAVAVSCSARASVGSMPIILQKAAQKVPKWESEHTYRGRITTYPKVVVGPGLRPLGKLRLQISIGNGCALS